MASSDRDLETLVESPADRESSGFLSRARNRVASLVSAEDTDPDPEAFSRSGTQLYSADADITRPDGDIEAYYEEYKNNPIIAAQIDNLALEVFEPGYWITADDPETESEIEEFLDNIGILGSNTHVPLTDFGRHMIVQHQVRGTFQAEKVTDDRDRHVALNPVNPSSIEIYTKPGTNVLLPPDYESDGNSSANIKMTENDRVAAFVQFDTRFSRWSNRDERRFTREQMIHWPREPDIGEQFGHSRIETVFERSQAMREKLQDNDLAIAMKAWPMVIFQTGSAENPWTREQREEFMESYREQNLGPGMYQAVPGDIDVEEFAGETADIESSVNTDVDMIVSGMPGPKHTMGSWASGDENEAIAGAYERQFKKIVRSMRRDIEKLLRPYLKEVARSWGYDPSGLELHIGRPEGEVAPEDIQGSIIRYQGKDAGSEGDSGTPQPGEVVDGKTVIDQPNVTTVEDIREERQEQQDSESDGTSDDESGGPDGPSVPVENGRVVQQARLARLAHAGSDGLPDTTDTGVAELSGALVATRDVEDDITDVVAPLFIDVRDDTLDVVAARHGRHSSVEPEMVADEFTAQIGRRLRHGDVDAVIEDALDTVRDRTADQLRDELRGSATVRLSQTATDSLVRSHRELIHNDLQSFGEELADSLRLSIRDVEASDEMAVVRERVVNMYDDNEIKRRIQLFARMALIGLVNKIKYTAYEYDDSVVGIEVRSNCSDATNELTRALAGCDGGEPARAMFDHDERVGAQLISDVTVSPEPGFDPLPDTPPFHFGDTAQYAPLFETNE